MHLLASEGGKQTAHRMLGYLDEITTGKMLAKMPNNGSNVQHPRLRTALNEGPSWFPNAGMCRCFIRCSDVSWYNYSIHGPLDAELTALVGMLS